MINFLPNSFRPQFQLTNTANIPNFSPYPCPDQWICYLKYNNVNKIWEYHSNHICSRKYNLNHHDIDYSIPNVDENDILLILESPHICEYDFNTHLPYGPAMGKSGCNICNYLLEVINNSHQNLALNINVLYRVVLINAIQFQTSQGIKPLNQNIRNSNFVNFITNTTLQTDFIQRIQYYNSSIICNLCTLGGCKPSLHSYVHNILNGIFMNNQIHVGSHPSRWFINANRIIR